MNLLHATLLAVTTPPDVGALFQPVADGVLTAINAILPVAVPVLVALAAIGIALKVFGKFGVRR